MKTPRDQPGFTKSGSEWISGIVALPILDILDHTHFRWCSTTCCTLSQPPYTALTAGIRLPLGLCKGTVSGVWKTVEISIITQNPVESMFLPVCLQIIQSESRQHQPMGGHVSYPTDSPTATKLRLCSSLSTRHNTPSERVWSHSPPGRQVIT